MSYPKKPVKENSVSGKGNSKLTEERRQRLEAIQQREQLKGLIVNKFIEKYGAKQQHSAFIDNEVNNFIRSEKVTEESLRKLESRIKKGMNIKEDDAKSVRSLSKAGQQVLAGTQIGRENVSKPGDLPSLDNPLTSENLQKLPSHQGSRAGSKAGSRRDPEGMSIAGSSMAPKSVYQLGDEDDEWAMIIKFDHELYKKEREMEKMREREQRSKIQRELDHLMEEKKYIKSKEQDDVALYNEMQKKQWDLYDKREKEKEEEKKKKIMYEKLSRDKQLQEENRRKKLEKQREKEIDDLLVKKIKEELDMEQQTILQRKKEEKDHLMRVMRENEENKKRALEEMKQERLNDIKAQQEYAKLIEKQEQAREAEIKAREDKAKKFMAMMSDTVIKDQKEQILDEERKILKHYEEKATKDRLDDDDRQKKLLQQKKEMRDFLDRQVQERNEKKKMEEELSKRQAEFWQKDSQEYFDNEKKKSDYIRDVNKKHADILKEQMNNKPKKRGQGPKVKMNTAELLQNKQILKEIANREGENNHIQRNIVIATHKN